MVEVEDVVAVRRELDRTEAAAGRERLGPRGRRAGGDRQERRAALARCGERDFGDPRHVGQQGQHPEPRVEIPALARGARSRLLVVLGRRSEERLQTVAGCAAFHLQLVLARLVDAHEEAGLAEDVEASAPRVREIDPRRALGEPPVALLGRAPQLDEHGGEWRGVGGEPGLDPADPVLGAARQGVAFERFELLQGVALPRRRCDLDPAQVGIGEGGGARGPRRRLLFRALFVLLRVLAVLRARLVARLVARFDFAFVTRALVVGGDLVLGRLRRLDGELLVALLGVGRRGDELDRRRDAVLGDEGDLLRPEK